MAHFDAKFQCRRAGLNGETMAALARRFAAVLVVSISSACTTQTDPPPPTTTTLPYAAVKKPLASISRRESLGFGPVIPIPRKGILLAFGSFFTKEAGFTVVDFDARTLERLTTTLDILPDGTRELVLTSRQLNQLSIPDLNRLIDDANHVWNPPPGTRPGAPIVTDVTCDVILFDGDDGLHQMGFACPYNTQKLVSALGAIAPYRQQAAP